MELKRYVMLNNNKVYDLTNEDDFNKYQTVKNGSHWDLQVKKRSDNILDLVEVGDLVSRNEYNKMIITEILDEESLLHDVQRSCYSIFAIYKRQPNGDYKKYEVK